MRIGFWFYSQSDITSIYVYSVKREISKKNKYQIKSNYIS